MKKGGFRFPPSLRGKWARGIGPVAAALLLIAASCLAEEIAPPERLRDIDRSLLSHTYTASTFVPEYTPPAPGTYTLPTILAVDDHALIDSDGKKTSLFALKKDRLAVVAFIYTACSEVTGCPLSQAVLQQVDRVLAEDPELAKQVVLVSASFDPQRDTPERLRKVRGFYQPRNDWRFVTTSDDTELQSLLDDFGQTVHKLRFEDGQWSGLFRHVLKVYLLDRENRVRNIYSVGFLNPPLVLNDLRTLILEVRPPSVGRVPTPTPPTISATHCNRRATRSVSTMPPAERPGWLPRSPWLQVASGGRAAAGLRTAIATVRTTASAVWGWSPARAVAHVLPCVGEAFRCR